MPAPTTSLSLIVAASLDGVIGRDGGMPWHLPEDLKHFRRTTTGHTIIMGRKTWDSIGRPLPRRRNVVVTRQQGLKIPGCDVVHSLEEAIAVARSADDPEPMVIGGATLYEAALPLATRVYLTRVLQHVDGDTWFPELDPTEWEETSRRDGDGVVFLTLDRVRSGARPATGGRPGRRTGGRV